MLHITFSKYDCIIVHKAYYLFTCTCVSINSFHSHSHSHIARNGKLTNGRKNVCQQARRAQGTLDLHIIKHPSVSIQHIFELFDCLIKPILCYGCEIYGAENYAIIETFH